MNSNDAFRAGPVEMAKSGLRNRKLIATMARRDVVGRYQGSVLGLTWSFFNPLLMLAIYTFVFSVVFNARWGADGATSRTDFAILLFVGMIIHGLFAECVNRAPSLILSNVNYVKKVIFPLESLPWVALMSALFHAVVSLAVLLLAQLVLSHALPWTVLLFPFVLLPLVVATLGFSWFLAALGVYLRDVSQITGMFTTALLFLSGVFYPISALPQEYQLILRLNPLAYIIDQSRNTLIFGRMPDPLEWSFYMLGAVATAAAGFAWFQRTRKGFADVV